MSCDVTERFARTMDQERTPSRDRLHILHIRCLKSDTDIWHLTSDICHTSDVWHLTSDTRHIRHQTSDIRHRRNQTSHICWQQTSVIRRLASATKQITHQTSEIWLLDTRRLTSDIRRLTSDIRHQIYIRYQTSDIRHHTRKSEVWHVGTSDVWQQTSYILEIRCLTANIGQKTSDI